MGRAREGTVIPFRGTICAKMGAFSEVPIFAAQAVDTLSTAWGREHKAPCLFCRFRRSLLSAFSRVIRFPLSAGGYQPPARYGFSYIKNKRRIRRCLRTRRIVLRARETPSPPPKRRGLMLRSQYSLSTGWSCLPDRAASTVSASSVKSACREQGFFSASSCPKGTK